ncbi:enoyl-CoA hydratase/isomerase family protein [Mycobacterium sp. 1274761.0]|uniref:enoyl-CoA hydratase/isomerase family protein n=1 Tax=Mycobacterium sp. 1274761.0 TaxID=1834077 RepID=UPI0008005AF4|nr:enoyl-CoA hydratase/isomerase family protein [Mycobacterium sp. 1274761.0]OBK70247.1 enoyl-CoA hydratase [Mycobacterium sp. 1274761.0]
MLVIDLGDPPAELPTSCGVVVAVGTDADIASPAAQPWVEHATFTLSEDDMSDRRIVPVESTVAAVAALSARFESWPQAATVCDQVLRAVDTSAPARAGVITESLAYSTLQAGGEFAAWLRQRGPATTPETPHPVLAERQGDTLTIRFNRPTRHNAFSNDARAALLEALDVARLDPSVDTVILSGQGPSFCSGGDLAEFGSFSDPATAHIARVQYSPALVLDELAARLDTHARIHGQVLGSGLELAAFCGRITSHPDAVLGLPELSLGLIPGAGGTVSVTRRIGRWRTAYLVLSGRTIDARTALDWALIDAIEAA